MNIRYIPVLVGVDVRTDNKVIETEVDNYNPWEVRFQDEHGYDDYAGQEGGEKDE